MALQCNFTLVDDRFKKNFSKFKIVTNKNMSLLILTSSEQQVTSLQIETFTTPVFQARKWVRNVLKVVQSQFVFSFSQFADCQLIVSRPRIRELGRDEPARGLRGGLQGRPRPRQGRLRNRLRRSSKEGRTPSGNQTCRKDQDQGMGTGRKKMLKRWKLLLI